MYVCVCFLVSAKCPLIIILGDTLNDDHKIEVKLSIRSSADISAVPRLDLPIKEGKNSELQNTRTNITR